MRSPAPIGRSVAAAAALLLGVTAGCSKPEAAILRPSADRIASAYTCELWGTVAESTDAITLGGTVDGQTGCTGDASMIVVTGVVQPTGDFTGSLFVTSFRRKLGWRTVEHATSGHIDGATVAWGAGKMVRGGRSNVPICGVSAPLALTLADGAQAHWFVGAEGACIDGDADYDSDTAVIVRAWRTVATPEWPQAAVADAVRGAIELDADDETCVVRGVERDVLPLLPNATDGAAKATVPRVMVDDARSFVANTVTPVLEECGSNHLAVDGDSVANALIGALVGPN